ncbi:type VI secretion system lipoprotein TssJ [Paraburkholderia sp. BCC1886]|uniref:type VI secretion system lipoprotein TssJ n=1 Tax=Paraburkholderia sp. BCC1886 TaxID=2562670 RepID=UPI001182932D|nr:type VI secretion system lipoprotein TssJ [Paraburkholderia sp. BCC1886]
MRSREFAATPLEIASLLRALTACGLVVTLAACASGHSDVGASRETRQLMLSIVATREVNPDDTGRAAPILVRVYELSNDDAFESADFFSLRDKEKVVLGDQILVREEFLLRPGDARVIRRTANPQTRAIGIVAAYRDLPHSVWRASYALQPAPTAVWYRRGDTIELNIELGAAAVKVSEHK